MKTEKTQMQFEDYITNIDDKHKETITLLDGLLVEKFTKDNRFIWDGVFWGGSHQTIVGYGEMATGRKDGATWFMIGLSIQKNYYSLYINAVEDNQYLAKKYAADLGKVKIGSSSISFTNITNLKLDTLEKMIDTAYQQWLQHTPKNEEI